MTDMPWVRFFPSDWLAGTRGMSAAETGIYITLVATMYERREPIPEDHSRLARLCGAPVATFKRTLETLIDEGKISRTEAGLWNKRVGEESEYRTEKSEAAVNAATARWSKKSNKNKASTYADAMQAQSDSNAIQKPEARSQIAAAQQDAPKFLYDQLLDAASSRGNCHQALAMGIQPIVDLLAKGYDLDADVLPVIREKADPSRRSWSYFVTIIVQRQAEKQAIPAKPQQPNIDWNARLNAYRDQGLWPHGWGPKPGEPGCRAPSEIVERHAA
ncbi:MAG: DUF1376 domain-containing protein [Candidatus Devosia phytovorans]|uniref:DUF1376 domain-containing protein n=1 Tax=Candidatus Devosia phytovorans TaxID=3121372 RepID=A0AAJ6B0H8_9HYPH|nr:DUF1376 domain-containing protein [Devosia sp.]WEK05750.1 MAG: DUF1376 domain-containing protein [Devosia sp.]